MGLFRGKFTRDFKRCAMERLESAALEENPSLLISPIAERNALRRIHETRSLIEPSFPLLGNTRGKQSSLTLSDKGDLRSLGATAKRPRMETPATGLFSVPGSLTSMGLSRRRQA